MELSKSYTSIRPFKTVVICFILVFSYPFSKLSSQEANDIFLDAEYSLEIMEFEPALENFLKLLKKDPENCNLNYKVGNCCFQIANKKNEAIKYFEKAVKQITLKYDEGSYAEKSAPPEALIFYGITLLENNQITDARANFIKYKECLQPKKIAELKEVDQQLKYCDNAEILFKYCLNLTENELPVASKQIKPVLSAVTNAEKNELVFLAEKGGKMSIYFSRFAKDKWSTPADITRDLNIMPGTQQFTICSMSADGQRLYLVITTDFSSSLYVAKLKGTRWAECIPLNRKINSSSDETHAAESPDGKELYITSNRKGTVGNMDIYICHRKQNGEWDSPTNLGKTINTYFNEETPFITNDNQHMYFSSEGHTSMGGYDVFVSDRLTNGSWGEPRNLGFPINTTSDDLFYFPLDSNKAYYQFHHTSPFAIAQVEILPGKLDNFANDSINLSNVDTIYYNADSLKKIFIETPVNYKKRYNNITNRKSGF